MNINLDIIPHYDARFDCLQNTLYSLLRKYVTSPQFIFFGTWNFKFQEDQISDSRIGNCLLSAKASTMSNCEKFFNIKFELLPADTKGIEAVAECLKCGEFVLIEIAADKITWSLNQDILMSEHYCLIRGIDNTDEALYVMDANAVENNQCIIPFSNVSIIKNMWRINMSAIHDCPLSAKETVNMLLNNLKGDSILEQEHSFLNYLKHHTVHMSEEVKGYEPNIGFCPFMWCLYNIGTGRYQISILIHRLLDSDYSQILEELYNCLTDLSKLWEDMWNVFIKYSKRPSEVVYQRIILHMGKIIEKEEQAYRQLETYRDEN